MKFTELKKSLQNEIDKVYVLAGDDDFLVHKAIGIFADALKSTCPEMDHSFFTEENWNISAVLASLSSLPMISEKRFVYINHLGKISPSDVEKMKEYLASPSPFTCLVIRKTEAFSFLKTGVIVDCKPLDGLVLSKLVSTEMEKLGKVITQDGISLLIEFCSFNLARIMPEIRKLASYNGEITSTLVREVVVPDVEYEVFALTNALSEKNGDKCFQILSQLLRQKQDIQMLLGLISSHFRRIIFSSFSSQLPALELANLFGVKEFAISKARTLSKSSSSFFSHAGQIGLSTFAKTRLHLGQLITVTKKTSFVIQSYQTGKPITRLTSLIVFCAIILAFSAPCLITLSIYDSSALSCAYRF